MNDTNAPILESYLQHCNTSTLDVAEKFSSFFSAIGTDLKKNMDCLPSTPFTQAEQSVFLYTVTELKVLVIIHNLDLS